MKVIDEKKINKWIVIVVLYLSFAFANWQTSRGSLAYLSYNYPVLMQSGAIFNEVVAFIIGGIVPLLFFEIVSAFGSRFVGFKCGVEADKLKYSLRFFYIGANIVIGAVKLVYLISPVITVYGNVLIDFSVTTVFFVGFLVYAGKHYVEKTRWGAMIVGAASTYLVLYALITVANVITGVLM